MINETVFLGECPIIRPEGIYYGGRQVIRLGMGGVGLGDVGDLLSYRQEWEPFIEEHLNLWRDMNTVLENIPSAQRCPSGIFDATQIDKNLDDPTREFCAQLSLTRMLSSPTHIGGILARWNAWAGKSSIDIVAGASAMLEWQQEVVMSVGGKDRDRLVQIAKNWDINLKLPDVPSFSTQQGIIARIQGAYVTAKGILQIIGYGANETLQKVGDVAQAVAQGLTDTAKALPSTAKWVGIAAAVAVAVVGGGLIIYYVPRHRPSEPSRT